LQDFSSTKYLVGNQGVVETY